MSTSLGWEGNRTCVTDNSDLSSYGLNGLCQGDDHPAYTPWVWHSFTFLVRLYVVVAFAVSTRVHSWIRSIIGSHAPQSHWTTATRCLRW